MIDAFGSKLVRNHIWTISDCVEAFWWSFAARILGSTPFHFDRCCKDSRLNPRMDDFSNTTQNWADGFQDHLKYIKPSPEPRGIHPEIILYHQSAQSTVSKSYRPPRSKTNLTETIKNQCLETVNTNTYLFRCISGYTSMYIIYIDVYR